MQYLARLRMREEIDELDVPVLMSLCIVDLVRI